MSPETRRAALGIGVVLVGVAAVVACLAVLYLGLLGCIFASSGCQLVGPDAMLVFGGAAAVFGLTLLAARAAGRGRGGLRGVLLIGVLLIGYAVWAAVRRWQGIVPPLTGAEQILLQHAVIAGPAFLVAALGAGTALIIAGWPDRGLLRAVLAVSLVVAAGAAALSLAGPRATDYAPRPEASAAQVLAFRVTETEIQLEPPRLDPGETDMELRGSSLDSGRTLFLLGPVTQDNLDALEAGDIEWRGDFFYPESPGGVVAHNVTGPASGYLGRVSLAVGRYAVFTTTERMTQRSDSTSAWELVRGPWAILSVE